MSFSEKKNYQKDVLSITATHKHTHTHTRTCVASVGIREKKKGFSLLCVVVKSVFFSLLGDLSEQNAHQRHTHMREKRTGEKLLANATKKRGEYKARWGSETTKGSVLSEKHNKERRVSTAMEECFLNLFPQP